MKKALFAILLFFAVFSCRQPAEEKPWPDDRLQGWLAYYGITLDDFTASDRYDRHYRVEQEFELTEDDLHAGLYIYSQDSTLAIDLDSYHLVLEEKEDGQLYSPGREVDMEVGLIDLVRGIRKRLLFCGTPCMFEEATFHPDGPVVVAGFVENENGFHPAIWSIDPGEESVKLRRASLLVIPGEIKYTSEIRLSHISFWFDEKEHIVTDVPL